MKKSKQSQTGFITKPKAKCTGSVHAFKISSSKTTSSLHFEAGESSKAETSEMSQSHLKWLRLWNLSSSKWTRKASNFFSTVQSAERISTRIWFRSFYESQEWMCCIFWTRFSLIQIWFLKIQLQLLRMIKEMICFQGSFHLRVWCMWIRWRVLREIMGRICSCRSVFRSIFLICFIRMWTWLRNFWTRSFSIKKSLRFWNHKKILSFLLRNDGEMHTSRSQIFKNFH